MKLIVDGLAIEYKDEGKGKVALMLHGWQSTYGTFDKITKKLKSNYRVVRLDLPGFGASEMPDKPWKLDDYIHFINDFLKKLKIKNIEILIGHSMGGRIAIKAVGSGQFTVKRLILIGSHGIRESNRLRNRVFWLAAKAGKVATYPLPSRYKDRLRGRLYKTAGAGDYLNAGALKQTFSNIIKEDIRPEAVMISVPTILIYGQNDTQTPPHYGKTFQKLIEDSKLEVIPAAGHHVHEESSDKVTELILNFCK